MHELMREGLTPEVIVLEVVHDSDWQDAEQFWISYMRAIGSPLLNATNGGDGIHGIRHTEETKARMSEAALRVAKDPVVAAARSASLKKTYSCPDRRAELSASIKASHARPEVKEKLCAASKKKASTQEFRDRMRRAHTGKPVSAETRAKLSAAMKGVPRSAEAKAACSAGHIGLKHSEETLQKMRDTWARKNAARKANG